MDVVHVEQCLSLDLLGSIHPSVFENPKGWESRGMWGHSVAVLVKHSH